MTGPVTNHLSGPASDEEKLLYKGLKKMGIPAEEMPKDLRNSVVKRSRKGPLGALTLRKMSGIDKNRTKLVVDKFEKNIGGIQPLIEGLEAVSDTLPEKQKVLLEMLTAPGNKKSLARLMVESGVEVTGVLKSYARGVMELGKVNAAIEAHRNLPALVKDLYSHALSAAGICDACGGTKKLLKNANSSQETRPCYFCKETGIRDESKLKEFATEKLLQITKQIGDKGGVNVTTNVGIKVEGQGSVMEKLMLATDQVLYKKSLEAEPIEAEFVPLDDHKPLQS